MNRITTRCSALVVNFSLEIKPLEKCAPSATKSTSPFTQKRKPHDSSTEIKEVRRRGAKSGNQKGKIIKTWRIKEGSEQGKMPHLQQKIKATGYRVQMWIFLLQSSPSAWGP